jgi:hypothetical protein
MRPDDGAPLAEPFKHFINAALVRDAALHLQRADAEFDAARFVGAVVPRLEALELKARAHGVAEALEATLPADFPSAAAVIERVPASVRPADEAPDAPIAPDGLTGWILWPVGEFVARRGLAHPERALIALHAITQRCTAEFAIRPFLERHPALPRRPAPDRTAGEWARDGGGRRSAGGVTGAGASGRVIPGRAPTGHGRALTCPLASNVRLLP